MKNIPISLEEIRKNRKPILNVNVVHKERLSALDQTAIWVTDHIGSMGFFILVFLSFAGAANGSATQRFH